MKQAEIKVGKVYEGDPGQGGYPDRRLVKSLTYELDIARVMWELDDSIRPYAPKKGACHLKSFTRWAKRHVEDTNEIPF